MFTIKTDKLIKRSELRTRLSISVNTLKKILEEDPLAPKEYNTPAGPRFVAAEVDAWLIAYDKRLSSCGSSEAAAVIQE